MAMTEDIFAAQPFGILALQKIGPVPDNFRLYEAGWIGSNPSYSRIMKVTGCEFREAKSGPRKGELCMPVKGTTKVAYITNEELAIFKAEG